MQFLGNHMLQNRPEILGLAVVNEQQIQWFHHLIAQQATIFQNVI